MSDARAKKAFNTYVDKAGLLADSVKRNIVHEGVIDNETVLRLNDFIIASNAIADLLLELDNDSNESNKTLN